LKFFRNISFWKKLLIMGVVPLALLGVIVGALSYSKADRVVKESEKRVLSDTINRIDISINVKARLMNSFMQTVAGSSPVGELAAWHEAGEKGAFDTEALRLFCSNTLGSFAEIRDVNVFIGDRAIYSTADAGPALTQRLSALYAKAERHPGKVNWSDLTESLFSQEEGENERLLFVYEGIRNSKGETVGLVVLELDPRTLGGAILTKQKILGYQTTFITDRSGGVIYSDNSIRTEYLTEILQRYGLGERKFLLDLDGTSYYVCSQYNGLNGWVTFTMIPENKLFPEAGSLRQYTVALVSISISVAALCLLIFSIAITKPLERLKNAMKTVQDEHFELQLENDRRDEIGELTESFNFMVNRINILIRQVYQEKIAQKVAEMEALQAQINPHFLYNTLDSINWMLIDKGEMEVSTIVVALGKLMKYSMDVHTSTVTLLEECRYVKDYLLIQKYRLEDKLEFTLELEPSLENFLVPKLILQPLIENAIDHGVAGRESGGRVTVRAVRSGKYVCIEVGDNGKGMTPDELYQYKRLLRNDPSNYENIGVRNVARRLQLHFNDACEFFVSNRFGAGVTVTIAIPVEDGGEEADATEPHKE